MRWYQTRGARVVGALLFSAVVGVLLLMALPWLGRLLGKSSWWALGYLGYVAIGTGVLAFVLVTFALVSKDKS